MPPPHAHCAAVADHELLDEIAAACQWWSRQRTWRVTSSYTGGGVIEALERSVARRVARHAYALALPSATTALVTALRAVGVPAGSTIGVPALGWTAIRAAAAALGVRTRALPVCPQTGLLDTGQLGRCPRLTAGLAAVAAVHLHGLTCDVPSLRRAQPELPIIEDASQAWAARYPDGTAVGSAASACAFSFSAASSPSAGELGCLVTRASHLHRSAVGLTQHPARQLLAGLASPRDDQPMTRVAPAAALLGAYAVQRHASQIPALRRAGRSLTAACRQADLPVLTDPALHAPGVVAVRAAPHAVRALLRGVALGPGLTIVSVGRPSLPVHPDAPGDQELYHLAESITTVTAGCRRRAR